MNMTQKNETSVIQYYIDNIDSIANELKDKGEISLCQYDIFNQSKKKVEEMTENNQQSQNKFDYEVQLNKLKAIIERIKGSIQNKKEYEFISNYFINENKTVTNLNSSLSTEDTSMNYINYNPNITEQYLNDLNKIDSESLNSLAEVLKLTSPMFLSEKVKLNDTIIQKIKAGCPFDNAPIIKQKTNENVQSDIMKKRSMNKNLLSLNIQKPIASETLNKPNALNDKIDKEIEEEINNQIFKYTRSMKANARELNAKLKQDSKTLSSIEDIQNVDQLKTERETKRLKEFNYSLSIGFFKLIMMFLTVIVTFVFTLLIIRIFPKLVK